MSLNTEHKVTLTEAQIDLIQDSLHYVIWSMENQANGYSSDEYPTTIKIVNLIEHEFNQTLDKYYEKVERAQSKQPTAEW